MISNMIEALAGGIVLLVLLLMLLLSLCILAVVIIGIFCTVQDFVSGWREEREEERQG